MFNIVVIVIVIDYNITDIQMWAGHAWFTGQKWPAGRVFENAGLRNET